jgi:hypothetical protein
MNEHAAFITDLCILAGIFLLGFIAKRFPKNGRKAGSKQ